MAAATITKRSFGYTVAAGGTDATTIFTDRKKIKAIKISSTNATDTVTITDLLAKPVLTEIATLAVHSYDHEMYGMYFDGLIVTLSATTATVHIYIA